MDPIKVMIADDHPLVRKGLKELLETQDDIAVVGEASDGREIVDSVGRFNPEILLLDLSLPGTRGLEVLKNLRQVYPDIQVVILSMYALEGFVSKAMQYGARGFVLKGEPSHVLLTAIRRVHDGKSFLSSKLGKSLPSAS